MNAVNIWKYFPSLSKHGSRTFQNPRCKDDQITIRARLSFVLKAPSEVRNILFYDPCKAVVGVKIEKLHKGRTESVRKFYDTSLDILCSTYVYFLLTRRVRLSMGATSSTPRIVTGLNKLEPFTHLEKYLDYEMSDRVFDCRKPGR